MINCLIYLDKNNADFGDQSEFKDLNGVLIGVKYIEKVHWLYSFCIRLMLIKSRYC